MNFTDGIILCAVAIAYFLSSVLALFIVHCLLEKAKIQVSRQNIALDWQFA
jgi:uncharacterized protein YybS (DUF2232 family)